MQIFELQFLDYQEAANGLFFVEGMYGFARVRCSLLFPLTAEVMSF